MDDLRTFISISAISGRWVGVMIDCAIGSRLRLKRSSPQAGLEPGTGISAGTELAGVKGKVLQKKTHL